MDHDAVDRLDSQPSDPTPATKNAPPAQTGATPVFNSMPQPSSGGNNSNIKCVNYNIKCVTGLCITVMVLAIICFIAQVVNIYFRSVTHMTGGGIVGAFFFILTASVGVYSARSRTRADIGGFIVLSFISALISLFPIVIGVIDTGYHFLSYGTNTIFPSEARLFKGQYFGQTGTAIKFSMGAIMSIAATVNTVLLMISSGFACKVVCCESSPSENVLVPGQVLFINGSNGQQMDSIPLGGQHQAIADSPGIVQPYGKDWTPQAGADAAATSPGQPTPEKLSAHE